MGKLLLEFLRPYRGMIAVILLAMFVQTAASLAAPWPLKFVLDNAIGSDPLPGWLAWLLGPSLAANRMGLVTVAALTIVLIAVISAIANFLNFYYSESVGQWVADRMRMRVFHHLDRFSLSYFDKTQTATLLSTITDDISTIQGFVSYSMLLILIDLLTIVGMFGIILALNVEFALITLGATPLFILFLLRFRNAIVASSRELRRKQSNIVAIVQESLQSMRVVSAFGAQDAEEAQLTKASKETVEAALKARKFSSLQWPALGIVVSVCTAVVIWCGASLILSGAMTVGELTVLVTYLGRFFLPFQDLINISNNVALAAVAAERVRAILDIDMSLPERTDARNEGPKFGEIIFEKVGFSYDERIIPALSDISFTAKPGQLIGIVGPTGSGKSTVASLIPRFYDVSCGRILIDGVDVRDYKLQALRSRIGLVLQDIVLFRGTVRENIAYGRPDASLEEIIEAARLVSAAEFISKLPNGYETQVGERGLTLSGGQRQRIGIARAIIRNATILILDEPTAALDAESEKLFMKVLAQVRAGRTVIIIAHRLSAIRNADKIFVIKDGGIVEQGTHDELLAVNGTYAALYRVQFEHPVVA
ncbi:MAG: ABC transporter ATP-binding protein [Beijerinckiaceae bacterium]